MAKKQKTDIVGVVITGQGGFHMRAEPNARSESLGVIPAGERLDFLGEMIRGWNKVRLHGKIGWLSERAGKAEIVEPKYFRVKKGLWHIRAGAGAKTASLGQVKGGTKLLDQGMERDGYVLVVFENQNAWISKRLVTRV